MKALRVTVLALGIMGLTGCQTMSQTWEDVKNVDLGLTQSNEQRAVAALPVNSCPQVKIVDELSALNEFSDLSSPADYNLISRVTLAQSESNCTYDGKNAIVDLKLVFDGQIGPKGRAKPGDTPTFSYPFFIAVTDSNNEIKAKEVFGASVTYAAGENSHTYYESLRQIIPVEDGMEAKNFSVLVGFQLSPDQLRYNRANVIPVASEARRLEETMKEQVQIGSNNASTPLGLTSAAAQQGASGIKITPGYPTPAPAQVASAATPAPAAPAKKAVEEPRTIKNPPLQLVTARKPARAAPAPEPAPEPAPAPAPAPEAAPAPAPAPVAIPGGETVTTPNTAPAPAPLVAPEAPAAPVAPVPAPAPNPAMGAPPAEPVAPVAPAPADPATLEKKDPEKGALNDKGIEMEQLLPAAGEETATQEAATAEKREPISSIDLTAPLE
jgi:hypothetical protein